LPPVRHSTLRWTIGVAVTAAVGAYLYGRYTAYVEHDRALTLCMRGHDSARAMCEQRIDLDR
jgi:hypothetical protein